MSFLGGIFDRKPGGTFVGNLLRTASSAATGGVLGQGTQMISQQQYDSIHLSDADFVAKYGVTKSGAPPVPTIGASVTGAINNAIHPVEQGINPLTGQPYSPSIFSSFTASASGFFQKNP